MDPLEELPRRAAPARARGSWRIAGAALALGVGAGIAISVGGHYRRGERRAEGMATPKEASGATALASANENLANQVRDYKQRLEALAAQQAATERQLADAQKKLALARDGEAAPPASP